MTKDVNSRLQITSLHKSFEMESRTIRAIEDLNFTVDNREFFCILGPSGCGKTTLLRLLAGLDQPSSGNIVFTANTQTRVPNIGMVFQEQGLFPWMTVTDNIRFLMESNPNMRGRDIPRLAYDILAQVGLVKFAELYPHQISGGMRQRVSIARAMVNEPDILLMDEPFVFLDYQTRLSLQMLLLRLCEERNLTVIFVTHDIEEAVFLADRVMVMSAHPGAVKDILDVDIPRPRDIFLLKQKTEYTNLVAQAANLVREEFNVTEI